MLLGIGTDIMKAERITALPLEDNFFVRVFSDRERKQASQRHDPLRYYASHFSGKEAVFKALSANPDHIRLNDIEILNMDTGIPTVALHGTAKQHALSIGIHKVLLSLSWEDEFCVAFAVALSD